MENTFGKITRVVKAEYQKGSTKKTKLVDGFILYNVSTGIIQVITIYPFKF